MKMQHKPQPALPSNAHHKDQVLSRHSPFSIATQPRNHYANEGLHLGIVSLD